MTRLPVTVEASPHPWTSRRTTTRSRLELELAGLSPDDVDIMTENGVLTVRGEKRSERKDGDETRYQVVERSYGAFMRTFQLPQGVDENQVKAHFENGVLSIHIPKAALPQAKQIQIDADRAKQQASGGGAREQSSTQSR